MPRSGGKRTPSPSPAAFDTRPTSASPSSGTGTSDAAEKMGGRKRGLSSASAPGSAASDAPLVPTRSRLGQTSSRPTSMPPQPKAAAGYASRAIATVSATIWGRPASEDSGSGGSDGDGASKASPQRTPAAPLPDIDTSAIVYALPDRHPEPFNLPLLVLNLAAVTTVPASVSNEDLLRVILRRMDTWVGESAEGNDYCLVVLAAEDTEAKVGAGKQKPRPLPGFTWWVWNWRSIDRKYRKNLKRLYIVHPNSPLVPWLISAFTSEKHRLPFVSEKAYAKIHTVPSLMALTHMNVSLRGMELPISSLTEESRVLHEDPEAEWPTAPSADPRSEGASAWGFGAITSVFGTATSWLSPSIGEALNERSVRRRAFWSRDIDEIVKESNGGIPRVFGFIGLTIMQYCTNTEGIFRRSANASLQALLNLPFHLQPRIDLARIAQFDPLAPPILLKRLVQGLGAPVFAEGLYPLIRRTRTPEADELLPAVSEARRKLLKELMHLAHHLAAYEARTRMGSRGLAIVLAPGLISSSNPLEDIVMLLEPGTKPPPGLGELVPDDDGQLPQTLIGVVRLWIDQWPKIHGVATDADGRCPCGFAPDMLYPPGIAPARAPSPKAIPAPPPADVPPPLPEKIVMPAAMPFRPATPPTDPPAAQPPASTPPATTPPADAEASAVTPISMPEPTVGNSSPPTVALDSTPAVLA